MHRFYFHNSSNNAFHHFANRNVALEIKPKQKNKAKRKAKKKAKSKKKK